jgi:PHP-associated
VVGSGAARRVMAGAVMGNRMRRLSLLLLAAATVIGTATDRSTRTPPLVLGGLQVIAADFHVHSSMWSANGVTPWGLVLEAERQGLDALAITGHNQVLDSKIARWFSRAIGGPTVLTGEEIHALHHHIIAIGIERTVDWRRPAAAELDDVHGQGGIAIAAHPLKRFWAGYDAAARARLDGTEVCHPMIYIGERYQQEFAQFAAEPPAAAIGSSDFHGLGRVGMCRTYVFARENTADAILEAIRARRTVVYGLGGQAYGDPALIALAAAHPELRDRATRDAHPSWLDWMGVTAGLAGLAGLVATRSIVYPAASPEVHS